MFTLQHVTFRDILTIDDLVLGDVPVTAIVGNSGSGKTTLLRLLNRMKSPTSGTITFQKKNLVDWNPVLLRRHVAMLSQTPVLFGESVRENLEAGCRLSERALPDAASREEALWRVHLHQPLDGEVRHLSGGEKQRLAIARVLLLHADVLLLDEPSSALDVETARAVVQSPLLHSFRGHDDWQCHDRHHPGGERLYRRRCPSARCHRRGTAPRSDAEGRDSPAGVARF